MRVIEEPGIVFGPFEEKRLFVIEHSDAHKKAGTGIKTVEFVYLTDNDNLWFVEAKKTCPNVKNKDETAEKQRKYEEFFSDVTDKFIDSIEMYAAMALGRGGDYEDIGKEIRDKRTYVNTGFKLILVVAEAEESWLMGPKIELETRLMRWRKIWKADVIVLNKQLAKEYGLIKEQ